MVMIFEEKKILGENKLLSQAIVTDTKKHEKSLFFSKIYCIKKCHFLIVPIIPSTIRSQNIMSEPLRAALNLGKKVFFICIKYDRHVGYDNFF